MYLVRLGALDWLSITKSAFSEAYFRRELEPRKALPFYLDAIDETVGRIDGASMATSPSSPTRLVDGLPGPGWEKLPLPR